jgi:hypothetical protein
MPSVLDRVPGLGGYLAAQQQNQQQTMGQLGQAQAVIGLQGALQQQRQEQELRQVLAESGGDVEKAMAAALKSGNVAAAARLAPVVEAKRKQGAGQPIGAGGLRLPDGTIIPPSPRPERPQAQPEIVLLQRYLETLPPDSPYRTGIQARIDKLTRDAPGVNVYSGSLTAGVDENGRPVFVQPSGRADTPPRIVPGVRPPPPPADRRAEAARTEALSDVAEIERLGNELDTLVRQNQGLVSGVVGPQGVVGRTAELVTGAVGGDTPALDFRNKSKLFLSSVRKMVEKDTNLSNEERKSLTESTGDGFWQTGASSIRARQDVMNYVKTKRISGLKPTIPPAGERVKDQVYQTPRGPMKWTGTGWLPAN